MLNTNQYLANAPILKIFEKKHLDYIKNKTNVLSTLIKKFPDEDWDMEALSENPNITWDVVEYTINKRWNWNKLSRYNPHITIEVIKKFIDFWDWNELSLNSYISYDVIEAFSDRPWNWDNLSHNKCIKFEYPETIIRNSKIGMKILENHPEHINWELLSENPLLNFDIVEKYPKKPLNWEKLSLHKNLTNNIVIKNISFPWLWHAMIFNTKINIFKIREKFPLINIVGSIQGQNPYITLEIVENFIAKEKLFARNSFCVFSRSIFQVLSSNNFNYNDDVLQKNMIEDNIINTIIVLETIDKQKLSNRAENVACRSSICDYNVVRMIRELL